MESKRKKRKVLKVRSATPEQPKSQAKVDRSVEELIKSNGEMVESLLSSPVWVEIVAPLIRESVASVSGRFTNGRYWHGGLTTKWDGNTSVFYSGYQKAIMDFNNNLHDFVLAKNKQVADKREKKEEESAPLVNPSLEEQYDN